MAFEELMGLANRLLGNAQTLAAIAAYLRLGELDLDGDLALRKQLERVLDLLGIREEVDSLEPQQRAVLLSFVRSYLSQAVDLVEDPAKENAWSHRDPALLQAQGRASGIVATLMAEAGLGSPRARILDVGTGVAGLAIAFCREFPQATVVGIDPWPPSLELARHNVVSADLTDRIALRRNNDPGLRGSRRVRSRVVAIILHPRRRPRPSHRAGIRSVASRRRPRRRDYAR